MSYARARATVSREVETRVQEQEPGRATGRLMIQFGPEAIATLHDLCRPDGRIFTLIVGAHLAVYAAAIASIAWGPPVIVQALLSIVVANQLHALTVLQHDCGHGSAYSDARGQSPGLDESRRGSSSCRSRPSPWRTAAITTSWATLRRPDEWFHAGRTGDALPRSTLSALLRLDLLVRPRSGGAASRSPGADGDHADLDPGGGRDDQRGIVPSPARGRLSRRW